MVKKMKKMVQINPMQSELHGVFICFPPISIITGSWLPELYWFGSLGKLPEYFLAYSKRLSCRQLSPVNNALKKSCFAGAFCLAVIPRNMYAWNEADILLPPQQYSDQVAAENDSSSFHYTGDLVPDRWQKPRGGFAGTFGEILVTLPLLNQMDREVTGQKYFIINWPLKGKESKPGVSGGTGSNKQTQGQTGATSEKAADSNKHFQKSNGEQPPDQEPVPHTHIGAGDHCYALGCNGQLCRCSLCLDMDMDMDMEQEDAPLLKKTKYRACSGDEYRRENIVQLLSRRQTGQEQISIPSLSGLSQQRLEANSCNPERTYENFTEGVQLLVLAVLNDGRVATYWESFAELRIWSPMMALPYGHNCVRFISPSDVFYRQLFNRFGFALLMSPAISFNAGHIDSDTTRLIPDRYFTRLSGHTDDILGGITLRDGRLVTWSEDQTVRIWSEQASGEWSSTSFATPIDEKTIVRELQDGSLMIFEQYSCLTTIWMEGDQQWVSVATINKRVFELRDGRLQTWTNNSFIIWTKCNIGWCPSSPIGHFEHPMVYDTLPDGRIVTVNPEEGFSSCNNHIRIWEKHNEEWASTIIGTSPGCKPLQVIIFGNNRFLIREESSLEVWEEVEGVWLSSTLLRGEKHLYEPVILNHKQILSFGQRYQGYRPIVWSQLDSSWQPNYLTENGTCIGIDHVLLLKDGRWVSWNYSGEFRIWSDHLHQGEWTSKLLTVVKDHKGATPVELPEGWLALRGSDTLRIWNLFPNHL